VDDESARISQIIVYINKDEDEPLAFNEFLAFSNGLTYTEFTTNPAYAAYVLDETVFNGSGCS